MAGSRITFRQISNMSMGNVIPLFNQNLRYIHDCMTKGITDPYLKAETDAIIRNADNIARTINLSKSVDTADWMEFSDTVLQLSYPVLEPGAWHQEIFECIFVCVGMYLFDKLAHISTESVFGVQLEELQPILKEENSSKLEEFLCRIGGLRESELDIVRDLDFIKHWGGISKVLRQEVLVLWATNNSLDNMTAKQALAKLRGSELFLSGHRMERFGGSFDEIGDRSDEDNLHLIGDFLKKIQRQCKPSDQELRTATKRVDDILHRDHTHKNHFWLEMARTALQITPLIPEGGHWHEAVFAIARIGCVKFVLCGLGNDNIPRGRRGATTGFFGVGYRQVGRYVEEENSDAVTRIFSQMPQADSRAITNSLGKTIDPVVAVGWVLWRIMPKLWAIDSSSGNATIKLALGLLSNEFGRGDSAVWIAVGNGQ